MRKERPSTADIIRVSFHNHDLLLNYHINPDVFVWIILGFLQKQYLQIVTVLFLPFQTLHFYLFFLPY